MAALTIGEFVERTRDLLELDVLGSPAGLTREVPTPDASGPGLVLAGYTARFVHQRLQVLGETEVSYLASLTKADRDRIFGIFFGYPIPCVMVTKGLDLPEGLEAAATAAGVAILRSRLKTQEFYHRITPFLEDAFAPATSLHGSLADVYGVGLLFTGRSGIGKSEAVLDLVERGHRLVADDIVLISRRGPGVLIGRGGGGWLRGPGRPGRHGFCAGAVRGEKAVPTDRRAALRTCLKLMWSGGSPCSRAVSQTSSHRAW